MRQKINLYFVESVCNPCDSICPHIFSKIESKHINAFSFLTRTNTTGYALEYFNGDRKVVKKTYEIVIESIDTVATKGDVIIQLNPSVRV